MCVILLVSTFNNRCSLNNTENVIQIDSLEDTNSLLRDNKKHTRDAL